MNPIQLRECPEGVILSVQAQPGSRRNGITGVHDGRLKVAVTQVAEKGKANQQVLALLADALQLPKSQLSILQGETSSRKSILIRNGTLDRIQPQLTRLCEEKQT